MKSFDSELKKYTDKIRLRATERRDLKERVISYMEYHQLPKQKRKGVEVGLVSQPFVTVHFRSIYFKVFGPVFAVIFLILVPIFAEYSVPGDVLYLIKTGVNEGIQSQFVNSPYEKVAFETRLIERRIAEARLLAQEGKLTEEVEAAIALTVENHANEVQLGLEELRATSVDEAAVAEIAFDSALEIQSAVLDTGVTIATSSSVTTIQTVVKNAREEALSKRSPVAPSYEGFIARIEQESTRAYELFESIKNSANDEERKNIERRLSDLERKIQGARKDETKTEDMQELSVALGLIQKLIVYMTDIEIRKHVSLETLVPVVLTDEERLEVVRADLEKVYLGKSEIESKLPYIEEGNLLNKVMFALLEVERNIATATSSIESGDIGGAESAVMSSLEIVTDLVSAIAEISLPTPEEVPVEDDSIIIDTEMTTPATSTEPIVGAVDGQSTE